MSAVIEAMAAIPGGMYRLGSDDHYPEERPARDVVVSDFLIDTTPVTNTAFAAFVEATGYVSSAERGPEPGGDIFVPTAGPVPLHDPALWWRFTPGACWHRPGGPGTTLEDRANHPVIHITQEDAEAFAAWRGARLPTEAEWEAAARGGLVAQPYAWGDRFRPDGILMANVWTGQFPHFHARPEGPGPSPVGTYPPNGYGLSDMIGNVWEWTTTPFSTDPEGQGACGCAAPDDRAGKLFTLKGGSYLCAGEYCQRYRPAARIGIRADAALGHVGFRCARDA